MFLIQISKEKDKDIHILCKVNKANLVKFTTFKVKLHIITIMDMIMIHNHLKAVMFNSMEKDKDIII
jgi:hypothetical protein